MIQTSQCSSSDLPFIKQGLLAVYNDFNTGRPSEALEILAILKRIDPDSPLIEGMAHYGLARYAPSPIPINLQFSNVIEEFGVLWTGEDLSNKSIEVVCDQGMGDIINMLRYLQIMKLKWNCRIVLNCYAHYTPLKRLIERLGYVDEFVQHHVSCDYSTNVFSLPAIHAGIKKEIYYPAHFKEVMEHHIPGMLFIHTENIKLPAQQPGVGVAWRSHKDNTLSKIKSIDLDTISELISTKYTLYSLDPDMCPYFMQSIPLNDFVDTANLMSSLVAVVSVDTAVLHLAGSMGLPTFGLIPNDCDPRWGETDKSVWYPTVRLFRQGESWKDQILAIKESLEHKVLMN